MDIQQGMYTTLSAEDVGTQMRRSLALTVLAMKNDLFLQLFSWLAPSHPSGLSPANYVSPVCALPRRPHAQILVTFMLQEWFSMMAHSFSTVNVQQTSGIKPPPRHSQTQNQQSGRILRNQLVGKKCLFSSSPRTFS